MQTECSLTHSLVICDFSFNVHIVISWGFFLLRTEVFEKALGIFLSAAMFKKMSSTTETVLFHLLPFVFLKKKSIDRAKLVVDRLGKSQLKSHWLVGCLLKKRLKEGASS